MYIVVCESGFKFMPDVRPGLYVHTYKSSVNTLTIATALDCPRVISLLVEGLAGSALL